MSEEARTGETPTLGVLMLEGKMARLPGCLGSERSFPYPVLHRVVPGSKAPGSEAEVAALLPAYAEAARELEAAGARAITDNCNGPMVRMQEPLSRAVGVPVALSGLLLVPLLERLLPGRRIGILTFFAEDLGEWHDRACGFSRRSSPIAIGGVGKSEPWLEFLRSKEADDSLKARMDAELVELARVMLGRWPDIGAWVCECTLLPPSSAAVRRATGLPVYDILNLLDLVMGGCLRPLLGR